MGRDFDEKYDEHDDYDDDDIGFDSDSNDGYGMDWDDDEDSDDDVGWRVPSPEQSSDGKSGTSESEVEVKVEATVEKEPFWNKFLPGGAKVIAKSEVFKKILERHKKKTIAIILAIILLITAIFGVILYTRNRTKWLLQLITAIILSEGEGLEGTGRRNGAGADDVGVNYLENQDGLNPQGKAIWRAPTGAYPTDNNLRIKREIMELIISVCNEQNNRILANSQVKIEPWYVLGVGMVEAGEILAIDDFIGKWFNGNQNASVYKNTHTPFTSPKSWNNITTEDGVLLRKRVGTKPYMLGVFQAHSQFQFDPTEGMFRWVYNADKIGGPEAYENSDSKSVPDGVMVNQKVDPKLPGIVRPNPYYFPDNLYSKIAWYSNVLDQIENKRPVPENGKIRVDESRYFSLDLSDRKLVAYSLLPFSYHGSYSLVLSGNDNWGVWDTMFVDFQQKGYEYEGKNRKIDGFWEDGLHTKVQSIVSETGQVPAYFGFSAQINGLKNSDNASNKFSVMYGIKSINYGKYYWKKWSEEIGYDGGGWVTVSSSTGKTTSPPSGSGGIAGNSKLADIPFYTRDWSSFPQAAGPYLQRRGKLSEVYTWNANGKTQSAVVMYQIISMGESDWAGYSIGSGIKTMEDGCFYAATAMAAVYMTGKYVNPIEAHVIADRTGGTWGADGHGKPSGLDGLAQYYGYRAVGVSRGNGDLYDKAKMRAFLNLIKSTLMRSDSCVVMSGGGGSGGNSVNPFLSGDGHYITFFDYDEKTNELIIGTSGTKQEGRFLRITPESLVDHTGHFNSWTVYTKDTSVLNFWKQKAQMGWPS